MTYDSGLAHRIGNGLPADLEVEEQEMIGGIGFVHDGNMCCGVIGDRLVARVGPDANEDALAEPPPREFDYTGRPMRCWVFVDQAGLGTEDALQDWLERCVTFVRTLPRK